MSLFREPEEVNDASELEFVRHILNYFKHFDEWESTLSKYRAAAPGSRLLSDDALTPHYPASQFAYAQIMVAFGSLQSLERMLVAEQQTTIHVATSPFGPYALVRNALDSAACAMWLLDPLNSKLRVKRRIQAQMAEIHSALQFRDEADLPARGWAKDYRRRMQEVADESGLGIVDVAKLKMPPTTRILQSIERHNKDPFSWLAAWQLCSGHAHGKQWAALMTHELQQMKGTATETGAEYKMTVSYGSLALVMRAAWRLMHAVCERYTVLAKPS